MKNFVREIDVQLKPTQYTTQLEKILSAQDIVDYLYPIWEKDVNLVERMYLVVCDKQNLIIGVLPLSKGGFNSTLVCMKYLFASVLGAGGCSFAIAHNHPSGSLIPSKQDDNMTKRILSASKIMDINFMDHIIINPEGAYYSYAQDSTFFNYYDE